MALATGVVLAMGAGLLGEHRFVLAPSARPAAAADRGGGGDLGSRADLGRRSGESASNAACCRALNLASVASVTDIDFSQFDLDQPLPPLTTNGEQGSLDKFAQWGSGKTLRQLAAEWFGGLPPELELVGTPDRVAARMGEIMAGVGGDGFLISTPFQCTSRRFINEATEGLVHGAAMSASAPRPH